jgi:hypothetical protein
MTRRLWLGVVGSPLVLLLHLQAGYLLSPHVCRTGDRWLMHLAAILALTVLAAFALISTLGWRRSGAEWPDSSAAVVSRDRFLSALGVLTTGLVALPIIGQWLGVALLHPCTWF